MLDVYKNENVICVKREIAKPGRKGGLVYIFLADGMLIDTGPKCIEADLIPFYQDNSFEIVALTHSHEDHSGMAPWIKENLNVPIYIHPKGISVCAQPCPYPKYRQIVWGIRKEFEALPLDNTIQSRNLEWKVIYTPGHADDHVCLIHEETGRLFTGDLFLDPNTKVIMNDMSIPVMIDSIRTLLSYDFGPMFCCHAGYIQDGKRMMKQKLDYLENLYGEVKNLYKIGLSITEIDKKLFPRKFPIVAISQGEWDSLYIVSSIVSSIN